MSTPGLISSLLLWVSLAMYTHRQPRATHAKRWLWASLPILFCLSHIKMIYITGIVPLILAELAAFGWCAFAISRITTLPRTASVYCAIWVHMTTLSAYELWQLLLWVFDDGGRMPSPAQLRFGQIGFTIAFYLIQYFTQVQVLPIDGKATVGPRQLGSALAVWGLFVVQFQCLLSLYGAGTYLPQGAGVAIDAAVLPGFSVRAERAFPQSGHGQGAGGHHGTVRAPTQPVPDRAAQRAVDL